MRRTTFLPNHQSSMTTQQFSISIRVFITIVLVLSLFYTPLQASVIIIPLFAAVILLAILDWIER